ncbi:MAG: class I SAM-dependent methyltransferase [Thermoplasmata archaeon]
MNIKAKPFDENSDRYEMWFDRNKVIYKSELLAVGKLLPKRGKGIEVGVGSGKFSEPFSIPVGVDPSTDMLRLAKKRGIQVIKGVGENLPIKNSEFDFVLIVTTICFFDDIKQALKEAKRILKPSGAIIIGFIDKDSQIGKKYQSEKDKNVFYKEAEFFSVNEVVQLLKEAGFSDFSYVQTMFHSLDSISEVEGMKEGYGEGSFVVIKGRRKIGKHL